MEPRLVPSVACVAALVLASACAKAPAPTLPAGPGPLPATAASIPAAELTGTLVYSTRVNGDDDIYLLDLDEGGGPVRLTAGDDRELDPALSADGRLIAFRVNPDPMSDAADIWVMGRDGSGRRNLTNDPQTFNWSPAWTPDGRIVFARHESAGASPRLWLMDADGGNARQLAEGWCEYPAAAPDGERYACAAANGGAYDIVVIDGEGKRASITDTGVTEFGPAWSPDGEWIAFQRDTDSGWAITVVRPDGSDERVLAPDGGFPTWDAHGRLIWSGPGGINVADMKRGIVESLDHPGSFLSWSVTPAD